MKTVLGCLMCLVLTISQGFAISGGPFGGGSTQVKVTGTYAGVFIPILTVLDPGPPPVTVPDNSLALFTLSVPSQGLAKGTVAIFRNGRAYTGDIQASADPDSAKVSGVISAIHTQTVTLPNSTVTFVYNDLANGFLLAKAIASNSTFSTSAVLLRGNQSSIEYTTSSSDSSANSGGPIRYRVHGFKQSETTN
ncbi:MAG: hypothetical protein QOH39_484 [Verrucomicrobiota bacterium]|jgi:hypothetical protein